MVLRDANSVVVAELRRAFKLLIAFTQATFFFARSELLVQRRGGDSTGIPRQERQLKVSERIDRV